MPGTDSPLDRAPRATDRCATCGHGKRHVRTHGKVTLFRGHPMCGQCREGVEELIADGWGFDELTGQLIDPSGSTQAHQRARQDAAAALYHVLNRYLAASDLTIELMAGGGAVSLTLAGTGDKFNVFPPGHVPFPVAEGSHGTVIFLGGKHPAAAYRELPAAEADLLHDLMTGLDAARASRPTDTEGQDR